jgi:hypothetical protein
MEQSLVKTVQSIVHGKGEKNLHNTHQFSYDMIKSLEIRKSRNCLNNSVFA